MNDTLMDSLRLRDGFYLTIMDVMSVCLSVCNSITPKPLDPQRWVIHQWIPYNSGMVFIVFKSKSVRPSVRQWPFCASGSTFNQTVSGIMPKPLDPRQWMIHQWIPYVSEMVFIVFEFKSICPSVCQWPFCATAATFDQTVLGIMFP